MKLLGKIAVGYLLVNIYYVVIKDRMDKTHEMEQLKTRLRYHEHLLRAFLDDQEFVDGLERRTLERIDQIGVDLTFDKIVKDC